MGNIGISEMDDKELVRCPACRGTKKIMGMGMMEQKCTECNGIGYIDVVDAEVLDTANGESIKPVLVKRRGRPKREVS